VIPTILSPMNSKTRMAIGLVLGAASASNNTLLRDQVPGQDRFLVKQQILSLAPVAKKKPPHRRGDETAPIPRPTGQDGSAGGDALAVLKAGRYVSQQLVGRKVPLQIDASRVRETVRLHHRRSIADATGSVGVGGKAHARQPPAASPEMPRLTAGPFSSVAPRVFGTSSEAARFGYSGVAVLKMLT
jgi:hypothetical protein